MNNLDKCYIAKQKAIAMINSCKTFVHYENTAVYLELFNKLFNNKKAYKELVILLIIKWFKLY